MSRVEPDETQPFTRRERVAAADENIRPEPPNVGHTPSKAEGDERDVDEALRNDRNNRR